MSTLEIALERTANGRLTEECRAKVAERLREFLRKRSGFGRVRALCAIGARGVSLRVIKLPPTSRENFEQLLALQIEKELPLPPAELAWGYYPARNGQQQLSSTGGQELVVVAVKKEVVADYAGLLTGAGLNPAFTLSALAASSMCPQSDGPWAILDVGRNNSELIVFENSVPTTVRSLPWGGENITLTIAAHLGMGRDEAERLKLRLAADSESQPVEARRMREAMEAALKPLVALLRGNWSGSRLYLTGRTTSLKDMAPALTTIMGGGVVCEPAGLPGQQGQSAAISALQRSWGKNGRCPALVLEATGAKTTAARRAPSVRRWVLLALLLALGCFSLRYVEAIVRKPGLAQRLNQVSVSKEQLPGIDRELGFLQYLETNQPPYLNAIAVISDAAARGTRIDSLSLTRRGDISVRGTMGTAQQATEFRSKLIASGWFSNVVLEEQTPVANQQGKIQVRISARWAPSKLVKVPPPIQAPPAPTSNSKAAPVSRGARK